MNKILTPHKEYYFEIKINPDLEAVAQVSPIHQTDMIWEGEFDPDQDVKAHSARYSHIPKFTVEIVKGRIGLIEFQSEEDFKVGIISHEAVHCATSYMRLFNSDELVLSDEIDINEECLAYLVGWFSKELTNYYYDIICT